MSPDEKQALVEKIDELPPEQRKRVEGYVDALHEMTQPNSTAGELIYGSEKEGQASEPVSSEESIDTEGKTFLASTVDHGGRASPYLALQKERVSERCS